MTVATALRRSGASFNPLNYGISWHGLWWADNPSWSRPAERARFGTWPDMSGNGRDFSQGTSTRQPAFTSRDSGFNGHAVLRSTQGVYMTTPTFTAVTQPVSVVYVGTMNTTGLGAVAFDGSLGVGQHLLWMVGSAGKINGNAGSTLDSTVREIMPAAWMFRGGASGRIDRNNVTKKTGSAGTQAPNLWTLNGLNGTGYDTYTNFGTFAFVGVFAGDITAQAGYSAFIGDLIAYYDLASPRILFIADGDSRCQAYYSNAYQNPAIGWVERLPSYLKSPVFAASVGAPSQTQATQNADAAAQVDTLYSASNTANYVFTGGGINDCAAGDTAATIESRIQTYCSDRRTAGFKVLVATLFPATSVPGAAETTRQTVNTWIRANWSSWADALVDLDGDSRLQNPNDTTYFADGVHLNETGWGVQRDLVLAALNGLGVS